MKDSLMRRLVMRARTSPLRSRMTPTVALLMAALLLFASVGIGVTRSRAYYAEAERAEHSLVSPRQDVLVEQHLADETQSSSRGVGLGRPHAGVLKVGFSHVARLNAWTSRHRPAVCR